MDREAMGREEIEKELAAIRAERVRREQEHPPVIPHPELDTAPELALVEPVVSRDENLELEDDGVKDPTDYPAPPAASGISGLNRIWQRSAAKASAPAAPATEEVGTGKGTMRIFTFKNIAALAVIVSCGGYFIGEMNSDKSALDAQRLQTLSPVAKGAPSPQTVALTVPLQKALSSAGTKPLHVKPAMPQQSAAGIQVDSIQGVGKPVEHSAARKEISRASHPTVKEAEPTTPKQPKKIQASPLHVNAPPLSLAKKPAAEPKEGALGKATTVSTPQAETQPATDTREFDLIRQARELN